MRQLNKSRMIANLEGEFLVFVIELQVHKLWRFWQWYPAVKGMNRMLFELLENKEYGLLSFEYRFAMRQQFFLMYWRSYEHMHNWALSRDATHIEGWKMLNQLMRDHPDIIGFWHESFVVQPDQYESFYRNVPAVGLGQAGQLIPLQGGMKSGARRLRETRAQAV